MEILNIFFYIILFAMGITFGSFYTLALYRIPKRQDITHTHSYCPNCNHKLGFLDLIPVFSYIFLGAKCKYCKQKIRPRYFIVEIVSGLLFVLFGFLLNLNIYSLEKIKIIDYAFFVLYFTFIILIAGIDKEFKNINKPVLMYGVIISIIYIVYLYIIDRTSIYRYVIYLLILTILLLIDTIILKKKAKSNYTLSILIMVIIMAIFTGEYIAINTVIVTLIAIAFYLIIKKLSSKKSYKNTKLNNENICFGFYLRSCKYDMVNRYTLLNFTKLLTERNYIWILEVKKEFQELI